MIKKIIYLLCLILFAVVAFNFSPNQNELLIAVDNQDIQKQLVENFKNENIPHRIDAEGAIWYPTEQYAAAKKLLDKVVNTDTASIIFSNEQHFAEVISILDQNNVEYTTRINDGAQEVVWSNNQTTKVLKLLDIKILTRPVIQGDIQLDN